MSVSRVHSTHRTYDACACACLSVHVCGVCVCVSACAYEIGNSKISRRIVECELWAHTKYEYAGKIVCAVVRCACIYVFMGEFSFRRRSHSHRQNQWCERIFISGCVCLCDVRVRECVCDGVYLRFACACGVFEQYNMRNTPWYGASAYIEYRHTGWRMNSLCDDDGFI